MSVVSAQQGRVQACALAAKGTRRSMEDRHVLLVDEGGALVGAIFDGHLGVEVAELAAMRFEFAVDAEDAPALGSILRSTHDQIGMAYEELPWTTGGACAVAFRLQEGHLEIANVGDSELVHVQGHSVTTLTELHRLSNPSERERVLATGAQIGHGPGGEEAYVVDPQTMNGLMPTRSLGDHRWAHVGIVCEPYERLHLIEEGWLVAACDGLWDVVAQDRLPELLEGAESAEIAALRLMLAALDGGSTDNVTVIAVRSEGDKKGADVAADAPGIVARHGDGSSLRRHRAGVQPHSPRARTRVPSSNRRAP